MSILVVGLVTCMQDFILFKHFIAQDVLTVFYILIALSLPFICWFWLSWMLRRYAVFLRFYNRNKRSLLISLVVWMLRKIVFVRSRITQDITWKSLNNTQKIKFIGIFLFIFFFSELFLRLTIEYLIAYMQMHEWLKPK